MRVARHFAIGPDGAAVVLTEREREVLLHVAAGFDHRTISQALGIDRGTTVTYMHRVSQAAGASNRNEMATWALLVGLVSADEVWALWERYRPALVAWRGRE